MFGIPLQFHFIYFPRACDSSCNSDSTRFKVLHGCGHSFHESCFPSGCEMCPLCKDGILRAITSLSLKADEAIQNPDIRQEKKTLMKLLMTTKMKLWMMKLINTPLTAPI